mgnify:CR=1 FL=1
MTIQATRIQYLNSRDIIYGRDVLYWMQQSQRAAYNHALEYAVQQANALGQGVIVVFGLMDDYPELMPRGIDAQQQNFIRCNTDGMRQSQPFINHLASNRGRYGGLSTRWNSVQEVLRQSHVRLDSLLGIVHP